MPTNFSSYSIKPVIPKYAACGLLPWGARKSPTMRHHTPQLDSVIQGISNFKFIEIVNSKTLEVYYK